MTVTNIQRARAQVDRRRRHQLGLKPRGRIDHTASRILREAFANRPRDKHTCVYCGCWTGGSFTCRGHRDLPALDPLFNPCIVGHKETVTP